MSVLRETYALSCPVYFIGFMGTGKTSVTQFLAQACGLVSVDTDEYLELLEDRVIADIFKEDGEDYFRALETKYLRDLSQREPCLIACGGGVVVRAENIAIMRKSGYVVFLEVTAEEAARRIPYTGSRPLFKDFETACKTLAERQPFYEAACDVRIDTVGRSVPEITEEIKGVLLREGVLLQKG